MFADASLRPGYLDQDVSKFFYRWGGALSAILVKVRDRFHGDLDQYLIYLIFLLDELSRSAAVRRDGPRHRPRGLNALSIAEITQIPRETARRKLNALVLAAYIRRGQDGLYYLGDRYGLDEFFFELSPLFWDGLSSERRSGGGVHPAPEVPDC